MSTSVVRLGSALLLVLALCIGALPSRASAADLSYTWFLVHVEPIEGGAKFSPTGQDLTKAPTGPSITVSGKGSFDPDTKQAQGGGQFTIMDAAGKVTSKGDWQVTGFVSWERLPGAFPPGFKMESSVPAPAGSVPSAGTLNVNVTVGQHGDTVLAVHCKLPTTPPELHQEEGVTLIGGNFNFTEIVEGSERTIFFVPASAPAPAAPAPAPAAPAPAAPAPTTLPTTGADDGAVTQLALILVALGLGLMGVGFVLRRRPK
jgi:hypothetical protein